MTWPAALWAWCKRHAGEAFVAGLAVLLTAFLDLRMANRSEKLEADRAERQEILENLRFVRERSLGEGVARPFRGLDLRGADLASLDLACPVRKGYYGRFVPVDEKACTDLSGAQLQSATLSDVRLEGAALERARLTGADLRSAFLTGARAEHAKMESVEGYFLWAQGADLNHVDFTGADLENAVLPGAALAHAKLRHARLVGADLTGALLFGAKMQGADLSYARLRGANLSNAVLAGAVVRGVCYDDKTLWPRSVGPKGSFD